MVGAIGFEPTTPCSRSRCATRLRYAPTLYCDKWPEKCAFRDAQKNRANFGTASGSACWSAVSD